MKSIVNFAFSTDSCAKDLSAFSLALNRQEGRLSREHMRAFFAEHKHLSAFLASYISHFTRFDYVAFGVDVLDVFHADLIVGDSHTGRFLFITFEGADPTSLFDRDTPAQSKWARDFERGYSRVIDWFWAFSLLQHTSACSKFFGTEVTEYYGMLVVGRSDGLTAEETDRLTWRQSKLLVDDRPIITLTYDDVLEDLEQRLLFSKLTYLTEEAKN